MHKLFSRSGFLSGFLSFFLQRKKERKITGETLKKKKGNDLSIASGVHIIVLGGSRDSKGFREPMKKSEDL